MRQVQVDSALARAFAGEKGKGKVQATITKGNELHLYHYQHLLLRYALSARTPIFTWHEKPTDKRILNAALEALLEQHFEPSERRRARALGASLR